MRLLKTICIIGVKLGSIRGFKFDYQLNFKIIHFMPLCLKTITYRLFFHQSITLGQNLNTLPVTITFAYL